MIHVNLNSKIIEGHLNWKYNNNKEREIEIIKVL